MGCLPRAFLQFQNHLTPRTGRRESIATLRPQHHGAPATHRAFAADLGRQPGGCSAPVRDPPPRKTQFNAPARRWFTMLTEKNGTGTNIPAIMAASAPVGHRARFDPSHALLPTPLLQLHMQCHEGDRVTFFKALLHDDQSRTHRARECPAGRRITARSCKAQPHRSASPRACPRPLQPRRARSRSANRPRRRTRRARTTAAASRSAAGARG